MKRSILLSATIMLIVLFVTLTTTTFAWYRASGGDINISGESTASVTTTGPDSPYLVIASDSSTVTGYGSSTYAASNSTITFNSHSDIPRAGVYSKNATTNQPTSFISNVDGSTITSSIYHQTFYMRNTGSGFSLKTQLKIYKYVNSAWTEIDLSNCPGYCFYLIVSDNGTPTYQRVNSLFHTATTYNDSTTYGSVESAEVGLTNFSGTNMFVFSGAISYYTVDFYFWYDGYSGGTRVNQTSGSSDDLTLKISFENIEVVIS